VHAVLDALRLQVACAIRLLRVIYQLYQMDHVPLVRSSIAHYCLSNAFVPSHVDSYEGCEAIKTIIIEGFIMFW